MSRDLRFVTRLAAVALLGLAAAGCAPQLDRIELAVQENHDEIATLQAENRRLAQEVKSLGALLRLESTAGDQSHAERVARLGQVSMRLEQLMQKLDDNAAYMRELSARVDLLATRQGVPTLGEYKPPSELQAGAAALPEEGRSIFQAAQLDRSSGNVAMARDGFRDFLERFASSELADDARYWLGDMAFGEQEYRNAADHFEALLTDHPETSWAPAALLKWSLALRELGEDATADQVAADLVERFPDSNEAALVAAPDGG
jgi:tol-pal system protein YbgF